MNLVCALRPEAGALCGSSARRDLCGGRRVTGGPTATRSDSRRFVSRASFDRRDPTRESACGPVDVKSHKFIDYNYL